MDVDFTKLNALRAKAEEVCGQKLTLDQFSASAQVAQESRKADEAARRSTQDERHAVTAFLQGMDGRIMRPDLKPADILQEVGVRKNTGTINHARRELKRLRLEHKPAEGGEQPSANGPTLAG